MKAFLFLLLFVSISFFSIAQNAPINLSVKGIAIDSVSKQPLGYVTVALQDAKTNAPVKSNLTKDDGSFELKAPAGKPYTLVLAFVGYQSKIIPITTTTSTIDVGKIVMQASTSQLKDVVITAVKPLMTQEVDRISYNVAADPESKSVTALDMMRKVPLLTVDANDNIQLKGSGNYKILINGKESALLAKNPSDVLRSMPGTNIVKIEVITTPPAKYDAEGLAGIINIITTKSIDEGYNIGINTRYNTAWGPGVNLNGTVKQGKFGFSGYAGTGRQNTTVTPYSSNENFFTNQSVLTQSGLNSWGGNYKYANGDFSYEIDTLNLLTASVDFETDKSNQATNGLTKTMIGDSLTQRYYENNLNNSHYQAFDASVNYQLGFKRSKDQLLTLSYKYSYSPNTQATNNDFSEMFNYPQANYNQYNNAGTREHTIQLDYAQPINKQLSMETGAKAILRNDFSDFQSDTLNNSNNQYELDPTQTNDFTYHQNIYSIYNSYQLKLAKWTAKAGLRLEETTVGADFSSVDTTLKTNYTNLIPSVSIQRSFTSTSSFNFGFTERIQRPDIYELNPFINRSNPQFITEGNPDLKPELNHVFELNYSQFSKGSINVGLSYSFSNNSIQNISNLTADNVTYSTYQNLGSNKSLGLNVNTNYPITKKLSITINGLLNYVMLKGVYDGSLDKNTGYVGNMFTSINYKFDDGYRIGTNTGYFSGNVNLQGKSSYFIFNSYVFSKDLLNKNATISFVANNPWSKFWNGNSHTSTPDFYQQTNNENTYRNFAIRLSYKFGKLNSDIKKNQHGIDNDDTKGKSSGNN
ncbi:TonB-dependent receptor domain-containing protein [Mucilaginibacter sp. E4BP6]|uniref:outer membrane beta-barrel family protein n=1 Tax=Mucilaginibacter sp. E4BP6 TaxID=2723089 RepID=UPI0015CB9CA8|nr:outer membrane beta-barrel family protein [Mucilaginibacter sp. E4BP6]NYE67677.1 outer membrane receptor protein involved in Fe transport [Mucilaginibacter sp. E4BP6]